MYTAHISALSLMDKRLWRQVPICASTLAFTSDQFRSSWRPGPNHIPRMQMGSSLQWKGPGRGTPSFQEPSRWPSLLLTLILASATCSYLTIVSFTASMSIRWDTKTVISSAYTETFALRQPTKGTPRRAGFALSSQNLENLSPKTRT